MLTDPAARVNDIAERYGVSRMMLYPTISDVQQLRALITTAKLLVRHLNVDTATTEQIVALSGSRLHRSP